MPKLKIGNRVELDVHILSLGLATTFDYYPNIDDEPRQFQITMLFQLEL